MHNIPKTTGRLHFIGIGGIGMSGIAEILATLGYPVSGSDMAANYNVTRLREMGITVHVGHAAENLKDDKGNLPAAVVTSTAIQKDNAELAAARIAKKLNIAHTSPFQGKRDSSNTHIKRGRRH